MTDVSVPAAQGDLATFQWFTLRYGRNHYAFNVAWYRWLLAELKEA